MQEQKLDQIVLWIFWKLVEVQVLVEVRFWQIDFAELYLALYMIQMLLGQFVVRI